MKFLSRMMLIAAMTLLASLSLHAEVKTPTQRLQKMH